MFGTDYKSKKEQMSNSQKDLNARREELNERQLFLTFIKNTAYRIHVSLLRGLEPVDDPIFDRNKELATFERLLNGSIHLVNKIDYDLKMLEIATSLNSKLDHRFPDKVSFKERREIKASLKDLEEIKKQAKNILTPSINIAWYLDAEAELVNSFVDYCINNTQGMTGEEKLNFAQENMKKLFDAQREYEAQIAEVGKVLVKSNPFKK